MHKALLTGSSLLLLTALVAVSTVGKEKAPPTIENPVLLELFTSQGCSSCPPADRLLTRLAEEEGVVALAYHVDYWNYIGWTDPFSSAAWSQRQKAYAEAFDSGRIYTPQLVVDGHVDLVGSNERQVRRALADARARAAQGRIGLNLSTTGIRTMTVAIDAAIDANVALRSADTHWDVMLAVFENGLTTPVPRGENAGRTLQDSHVVRRLERAFALPVKSGAQRLETLTVELEKGWNRKRLGVAVFIQDPTTRTVHGSAVRHLTPVTGS